MTVKDLMSGITPSETFAGSVTADDMVLAICFDDAGKNDPGTYLVADDGVTDQSGALEATNAETNYLRRGVVANKTGTKRTFTITGDRIMKEPFQDALLAHEIKYGTGEKVIRPYVYFCALTGKGEKGLLSIAVENDQSGEAGGNAGWSATLTGRGKPEEYAFEATV